MTDRVGQQLGNYRLLRLLGHGGFAEVYLGEHMHLGTYGAIKVLHTQLGGTALDTFRTEARTIASLEHPHIIRVLEFGMEGVFPFLVMDYAPNGTLRHRHPKGTPLPLETVLSYTEEIAEALQYAHDERLIHRDVKPENMLVGRRGTILLSDFGIAVAAHQTHSMSLQNEAGTVLYMAPEQIQGKARPASDQYALAAVVYEWLSGSPPFMGTSSVEIAMKHLSEQPPDLHTQVPSISPAVSHVVMKALAKDPQRRFACIEDFAVALREARQRRQYSRQGKQYQRREDIFLEGSQSLVPTVRRQRTQKEHFSLNAAKSSSHSIQSVNRRLGKIIKSKTAPIQETPLSDEELPISPVKKLRHPLFWFLGGNISAIVLLALIGGLLLLTHLNDILYGSPRTFQIDAVVGQGGDSPSHPSHFIALNENHQAVVIELQAGDPAKSYSYTVPLSNDDGKAPVTLEFRDVTGDGKLDMIIHIHLLTQEQIVVFINTGDRFRLANGNDQIKL